MRALPLILAILASTVAYVAAQLNAIGGSYALSGSQFLELQPVTSNVGVIRRAGSDDFPVLAEQINSFIVYFYNADQYLVLPQGSNQLRLIQLGTGTETTITRTTPNLGALNSNLVASVSAALGRWRGFLPKDLENNNDVVPSGEPAYTIEFAAIGSSHVALGRIQNSAGGLIDTFALSPYASGSSSLILTGAPDVIGTGGFYFGFLTNGGNTLAITLQAPLRRIRKRQGAVYVSWTRIPTSQTSTSTTTTQTSSTSTSTSTSTSATSSPTTSATTPISTSSATSTASTSVTTVVTSSTTAITTIVFQTSTPPTTTVGATSTVPCSTETKVTPAPEPTPKATPYHERERLVCPPGYELRWKVVKSAHRRDF